MSQSLNDIRADFDRIARLPDGGWDHNAHYHGFLLRQLPAKCGQALEIGCGKGAFARLLAERSERVLALDLSPEMIRAAEERSAQYSNIEYQVGDIMAVGLPDGEFDCVVSIATLHHMPLAPVLAKLKPALKPGGVLAVLDLYRAETIADFIAGGMAFPASAAQRLARKGRLRPSRESRAVWAIHGARDHYLTLAQVRAACADAGMPGARVRRHLLWRYSLVWRKP